MSNSRLKTWAWLHKWSSLVCTVFMLLLCLTGLPLIFHHEIGHWLGSEVAAPHMPPDTPDAPLAQVMHNASQAMPGLKPVFLFQEPGERDTWRLGFAANVQQTEGVKAVVIDARTAQPLAQPPSGEGFIYLMFRLHVDLFAGLPGKLFLGLMGMLLLLAIVSGLVLYAPFMRRLPFATIRRHGSRRLVWLDYHNLTGVLTLCWLLVVGGTGVINTWADLVIKWWQFDQLATVMQPYQKLAPPQQIIPLAQAVAVASAAAPGMQIGFVAFPGTRFASPHHYGVFLRGQAPVSSRLYQPVLIDAANGKMTAKLDLPWYVTALLMSQPLHFGDYGGMGLKLVWAALDVITIIVLLSGLYLWWQKHKRGRAVAIDEAPGSDA